jgi:hypothetical protein
MGSICIETWDEITQAHQHQLTLDLNSAVDSVCLGAANSDPPKLQSIDHTEQTHTTIG